MFIISKSVIYPFVLHFKVTLSFKEKDKKIAPDIRIGMSHSVPIIPILLANFPITINMILPVPHATPITRLEVNPRLFGSISCA